MVKKLLATKTLKDLIIRILMFIVIGLILGVVSAFVGGIPVIGKILGIVCWIIDILCTIGLILCIVGFIKNNV